MAWDLVSKVAWMKRPRGGLLEVSGDSFLASWGSRGAALGRSRGVLGEALEASWVSVGALKDAWSSQGVLPGTYAGLCGGALVADGC